MLRLLVALVLPACSFVPQDRGPDPLEALEARVAALEAEVDRPACEDTRAVPRARGGLAAEGQRRLSRPHRPVVVHEIEVHHPLIEVLGQNLDALGRVLAHRGEDGAFDGYRVSAIRRGSPVEMLGLRNGDVIHRVSGHPVTSLDEALHAWADVAGRTDVVVELSRRGEPVELHITVRP